MTVTATSTWNQVQVTSQSICNRKKGPYSNTGLPDQLQSANLSLRGDLVKLSIRRELLPADLNVFAAELKRVITPLLTGAGWTMTKANQIEAGQNGFERAIYLRCGNTVKASIQWGGKDQRGWVLLHICGGLCAILPRAYWTKLYSLARRLRARLGSFDLAGDDFAGLLGFSPHQVKLDYFQAPAKFIPGHRSCSGIPPKFNKWISSDTGSTLYLGGMRASVRHRVYEKGKQLDDRKRPDWVRWEVMFRRTSGKTELDLGLLYPGNWEKAWLGSCHYLETKFKGNGGKFIMAIEQAKRGSLEIAARGLLTLEKQWGGTIGHLVRVMGVEGFLDVVQRKANNSPLEQLQPGDTGDILELRAELLAADAIGDATAARATQQLSYAQEMILEAWQGRDLGGEDDVVLLGDKSYFDLGDMVYLTGTSECYTSDVQEQGRQIGLDLAFTMDLLGDRHILARELSAT